MGFQEALWVPPVLGLSLGLAIGLAAFRLGALGGGDGKLLAALGACLGAVGLLAALPWIALVGGLGALGARIRGRGEVVFGPALFLGYVLALSL
jgi:Flp pilus assembly protein protease CpaA